MKRVFVFVNGIENDPGKIEFTDTFPARVNEKGHDIGDAYEYAARGLFRRLTQKRHAKALADKILLHANRQVIPVCHSNGNDLLVRALRDDRLKLMQFPTLHMIAAACDADFSKNGLNEAMLRGTVGKVLVWRGGLDKAMLIARFSQWAAAPVFGAAVGLGSYLAAHRIGWSEADTLGWALGCGAFGLGLYWNLGYGSLGRDGPQNVDPKVASRVGTLDFPGYGHSTFIEAGACGDDTLRRILGYQA